MHDVGARGVRINLATRGEKMDREACEEVLGKHADKVRPLGWCLQLYVSFDQIALLAPLIPALGVPVVLDHLGSPHPSTPPRLQPGYRDFLDLLKSGRAWTKLSGTYRFADTPDLDEFIKTVLREGPDQVVWASDWPHSGGTEANPGGGRDTVQEYRKVCAHAARFEENAQIGASLIARARLLLGTEIHRPSSIPTVHASELPPR